VGRTLSRDQAKTERHPVPPEDDAQVQISGILGDHHRCTKIPAQAVIPADAVGESK